MSDREDEEGDWFSDRAWRTDWPGFARYFLSMCFTEPGSEALIDEVVEIALDASPEILITQAAETDWMRLVARLPEVTCPTLFIAGDSDATAPLSDFEAAARAIRGARLEIIPRGGHRPDIRSPELVNPILGDFLGA